MRRAIAAAVIGGLVLGGTVATPSVAAVRGAGKAPAKAHSATAAARPRAGGKAANGKAAAAGRAMPGTARAKTARKAGRPKSGTAMKTVVYAGYEFQVPASWPVYRLDEHPRTCVRYDVHAVYLGTPGPDMRCTAGLVGRTQTVSLMPGNSAPRQVPGRTVLQRLGALHGTVTQDTVSHELRVALGTTTPAATLLGTYGTSPAIVDQVLGTLRPAPAGAAPTAQSASAPSPSGGAAGLSQRARLLAQLAPLTPQRPSAATAPPPPSGTAAAGQPAPSAAPTAPTAPARPAPKPTYTSWRGMPPHWPVQTVQPSPSPSLPSSSLPSTTTLHPVSGFDTCTAPSTSTMRAWRSHYAAIGVYIGGANAACARGNLTAGWIKTVAAMGWGLLPAYVGPQAPCWSGGSGVLIKPGSAAAQGSAAGADAVNQARAVRLPAGSPVYYDMEAYRGGTSCTSAVLDFLGAWDRQVSAAGYQTGVYSSQDSGIVDMQSGAVKKTPGFTPPEAVWIALWDNVASLSDGTLTWPKTDRSKQYAGNVNATIGGITLNIDRDLVGGPLARLAAPRPARERKPAGHAKLVRVNRRGLISSRHGPTQRPS